MSAFWKMTRVGFSVSHGVAAGVFGLAYLVNNNWLYACVAGLSLGISIMMTSMEQRTGV